MWEFAKVKNVFVYFKIIRCITTRLPENFSHEITKHALKTTIIDQLNMLLT